MSLGFLPPSHPTLHAPGDAVRSAAPFARCIKEAQQLMQDYKAAGVALPQIGVSVRIFVSKYKEFPVCVNPSYQAVVGSGRTSKLEGTLNKPGWHRYIPRWDAISASWTDFAGAEQTAQLTGMEARVFQHLTDACDGKPIFARPEKPAAA